MLDFRLTRFLRALLGCDESVSPCIRVLRRFQFGKYQKSTKFFPWRNTLQRVVVAFLAGLGYIGESSILGIKNASQKQRTALP